MPESVSDPRAVSRDIFSATIGSICCCYTGQPFDTVRVRMQTRPTVYTSILTSTTSIWKHEGVTAFWKGSVPTFMGMVGENIMAFGVNEALQRAFPDPAREQGGPPSLLRPFCTGILTGTCLAVVLVPSEVVKTKLQVVVGKNVTAVEIMKEMIQKQGYRSFACGMDAQIARDSAFYACFFGGYQMFCYGFRTYLPWVDEKVSFFFSGGFAGCVGWALAMPFDVPKTNVQARYDSRVVGSYIPELVRIAKQRGVAGLYTGLGPTLVRAFPANAALFLGVEMGKKCFDNYLWRKEPLLLHT